MATDQEKQDGIADAILKIAAEALIAKFGEEIPKLVELGVHGVASLLHHKKKAIIDVIKAADVKPGDPLPPDPTHPHP